MQKEITLLPTFRAASGQIVQGSLSKLILPGRTTAEPGAPNYVPADVQTISYEKKVIEPVGAGESGQSSGKAPGQMRTTTINLASPIGPKQPALNHQGAKQTSPGSLDAFAASTSPAAQSMVEQARQQLIAEAFQQTPPAPKQSQPMSASWNPPKVPSASSQATSYSKINAPEWAKPQQLFPNARANQAPIGNTSTIASAQPRTSEEGVDLPPGVQLSPRATAW